MRLAFLTTLLLSALLLQAQAPQAFDFQGVARDATGQLLALRPITLRISLHADTPDGTVVYQETHTATTSPFGLFDLQVGQGIPMQGSFPAMAWGASSHFIQVEMDPTGGTTFTDMGTSQLLSVPYALHARTVDCFSVSLRGDTLKQGNGCYVIIPGISVANGGCKDADGDGYYDQEGCGTLVDCNDNAPSVNPAFGCTVECTSQETASIDQHQQEYLETFIYYRLQDQLMGTNYLASIIQGWQDSGHLPLSMECHQCAYAFVDCVPVNACLSACLQGEENCLACYNAQTACLRAFITCTGLADADNDGWSTGSDCDDNAPNVHPGATEACNGIDDNCNGTVDEGACPTEVCDDGVDNDGNGLTDCDDPACAAHCAMVDADGDGYPNDVDCDDNNMHINPGVPEKCNGLDDNCDGMIDEGMGTGQSCGVNGIIVCDANGGTTCLEQ